MSKTQFYRSKLMLSALNIIPQDVNLSRLTVDTLNQSSASGPTAHNQHCDTASPEDVSIEPFKETQNISLPIQTENIYDNPTPGVSGVSRCDSNKENNDGSLSDISNLYDSDDSVKDPDFILDLLTKEKRRFSFPRDSDTDSDELECFAPVERDYETTTPLSLLPPPSIFIATYPDTIIFKDQDQANCYEENTIPITYGTPNVQPENQQITEDNAETRSENSAGMANKKQLKYPFIEETCGNKCKRECNLFSEEDRKMIWNTYWDMNNENRRSFLNKCTKIVPVKRRKTTDKNPNPKFYKTESRFYYLPKINEAEVLTEELNVCRNFFLKTLGYKTDAVITELSRGIKRNVMYGEVSEKRGGKKRRLDRDPICNHILSFNPAVSHYRRSNAPLTRYLPRTLTVNFMFNDFKKKFPNFTCSKELYRKTIKQMRISFKYPKGDKCTDCESFEQKTAECENGNVPETLNVAHESHKIKANKAVQKYKEDASKENTTTVKYYSMDMQKVLLLPDMPQIKDSLFLSRLVAFNLTFAPIQKMTNINSICVLWHEAWAGRDGSNIVDALAALIEKQRDLQHLVIWCDNCTCQNKNWILYTALVTIVNSGFSCIETINLKYLTKGHTHMTADGVHGNIETQMRRRAAVYDYEDYKDVVRCCRLNIEYIEVQKKYLWKKQKRTPRRNISSDILNTFKLNSVVDVKFVSGSRKIFFRLDFDEPYIELDFLMKKFNHKVLPETNTIPRGIKQCKKDGIVAELVPLMPTNRRQFWINLPVCDTSEDLVTGGQMVSED